MQIFLIRHAHAVDGADDALRPLSPKGRRQIRQMATFLRRGDLLPVREFWHSPLVRARQTSDLLAARLGSRVKQVEISGIEPYADPQALAVRLAKVRRPIAVIGHEPHLSALATLLLSGRAVAPIVRLRKGAILALERTGQRWEVLWLISPAELLPG